MWGNPDSAAAELKEETRHGSGDIFTTNGMHSAGLTGMKAGKLGGVGSAAKKIETCDLPNSLAATPIIPALRLHMRQNYREHW
jgi:hypothetical protein